MLLAELFYMKKNKPVAFIIAASSDIGGALSLRWKSAGWYVCGTYRNKTKSVEKLIVSGIRLFPCDLSDVESIKIACNKLRASNGKWDILVLCPGSQDPVERFMDSDFNEWEKSININFTSQMRIVRELLPFRNKRKGMWPCVLFFAGGGTNNAVKNYSAYTVSKIALIKMCELLDAEIPDTRFAIIGPGWVKTKIHKSTLDAGLKARENYKRTLKKLASNECTPIKDVLDCCDWIINKPKKIISGRNFSVVYDRWGAEELEKKILEEPNMYKLRRFGNDYLVKEK